jgi:hypothetical protein
MPVEIVAELPPEPVEVRSVEFLGKDFAIATKIGLMPLMRFAHAAKSGLDSDDMEGMAAMYDMLRQAIADEPVFVFQGREITRDEANGLPPEATSQVTVYGGWDEFEAHATRERADDAAELFGVIQRVMTILSQRPTSRPSDSSAGPQQTAPISAADSSSLEVVRRLKSQGRPDLAMAVYRQQTG